MDVSAVSNSSSVLLLAQQVDIAITKKAMNYTAESSEALINMMERSVNPNIGSKIDVKV
jgi:hypothetical protein